MPPEKEDIAQAYGEALVELGRTNPAVVVIDTDIADSCQTEGFKKAFPDRSFDVYTIAFGLRNVTHIDVALQEARRVLKPGGRFCVWEAAPSRHRFMQVWNLKLLRLGVSVVHLRTAAELRGFLEEAGFSDIQPYGHGLYYFYPPLPRAGYIATRSA